MNKLMNIPYGVSDFSLIKPKNEYYVDKTKYIPELEKSKFVFLIRPRRFGKSLFLSMLEGYYDVRYKDQFTEYFKDTWILKNETENRGKYLCIYLDFSGVQMSIGDLQENFNDYCLMKIKSFLTRQQKYLTENFITEAKQEISANKMLQAIIDHLKDSELKLYLFIDEYDNFANTIISEFGNEEYQKLTHGAGYFKEFFKILKSCTSGMQSGLERLFITGVSPVTMDDVSSGFNIGTNISLDENFNAILGFDESEVTAMLDYYLDSKKIKVDRSEILRLMKIWYDNYRFSKKATETVYNTDAVLYFIKKMVSSGNIPDELIDNNLRMDYSKLKYLIVQDQRLNGNFDALTEIIETGGTTAKINMNFPLAEVIKRNNYVSLLYFLGLITYSGEKNEDEDFLKVPNNTIKRIVFEYLSNAYKNFHKIDFYDHKLNQLIRKMAYRGDFKPVIEFIANLLEKHTSVRDFIKGENTIKFFYLAIFFLNEIYTPLSELEVNKGYADLIAMPNFHYYPDMKYAYIMEFKYISGKTKKKDLHIAIQEKLTEAKDQLVQYTNDNKLQNLLHIETKTIAIIFHKWKLIYCEEIA